MRPLFMLALPVGPPRVTAEIRRRLQESRTRFEGTVLKRHVQLTLRDEHRHFWSPYLSLDILERDGQSALRGRYSPHPSIWTFLMAIYGVLLMAALASGVYGASQLALGWTPWAFLLLPLCALCLTMTWLASAMGQRLAQPQMLELHDFLNDCVVRASEPPPSAIEGEERS